MGAASFPYTSIDQFKSVEEVSALLDAHFHGQMHSAVGFADGGGYVDDVTNPVCSPRDPMFWRLHKALDDTVRAWQNVKAADVVVLIDRSGSMTAADSTGASKISRAVEAAEMFGDLLEDGRSDGQENRIGVVSYSTDAANATLNMPLTVADASLLTAGGPFETVLSGIQAGVGGWTSIGSGVEAALKLLCPPSGDCATYLPPAGENSRKGILLLTDGMENRPPCLHSLGPVGPPFDPHCYGLELDRDTVAKLGATQVSSVGFGDTGSLDGDLLTLFSEKQGGIYMQNSVDADGEWIDLKDFFVKSYGILSDEFLGLDPKGTLAADQLASAPVEYTSCGDERLTFAAGWNKEVTPGDLRLVVTGPSGRLVRATDAGIEASTQGLWDYNRVPLPYHTDHAGTWRAQIIRPHQVFVNGFTTDSFRQLEDGVAVVRRQIQRLCPARCRSALYYEDMRLGPASAYEKALDAEHQAGGSLEAADVRMTATADDFLAALRDRSWDLVVYAHQGPDRFATYDQVFTARLCDQNQRAIITDTRENASRELLACAGVRRGSIANLNVLHGDGQLIDGDLPLINPGYAVASHTLDPIRAIAQGWNGPDARRLPVVAARSLAERPVAEKWFVDVLVKGQSRLDAHKPVSIVKAGDDLLPTVRMLPAFGRRGGYDKVEARVEIERPLQGLGTLFTRQNLADNTTQGGESISRRAATLPRLVQSQAISTTKQTFTLTDDGRGGDIDANNAFWSAQLPKLALVDGMYQFHVTVDFTAGACTTQREFYQSIFVDVEADPDASDVQIGPPDPATGVVPVTVRPRDALGNFWGPGRVGDVTCQRGCDCSPQDTVDRGNGTYTINVKRLSPTLGCRVNAFGTAFVIPGRGAARVFLPFAISGAPILPPHAHEPHVPPFGTGLDARPLWSLSPSAATADQR